MSKVFGYTISAEDHDEVKFGAIWAGDRNDAGQILMDSLDANYNNKKGDVKIEDQKVEKTRSAFLDLTFDSRLAPKGKVLESVNLIVDALKPINASPVKVGEKGESYLALVYSDNIALEMPVLVRAGKPDEAAKAVLDYFKLKPVKGSSLKGSKKDGWTQKVGAKSFGAMVSGTKVEGTVKLSLMSLDIGNEEEADEGFDLSTWGKPAKKKSSKKKGESKASKSKAKKATANKGKKDSSKGKKAAAKKSAAKKSSAKKPASKKKKSKK